MGWPAAVVLGLSCSSAPFTLEIDSGPCDKRAGEVISLNLKIQNETGSQFVFCLGSIKSTRKGQSCCALSCTWYSLGEHLFPLCRAAGAEGSDCGFGFLYHSAGRARWPRAGRPWSSAVKAKCHRSANSTRGVRTRRREAVFAHSAAGHGGGPAGRILHLLNEAGMTALLPLLVSMGPGIPDPVSPGLALSLVLVSSLSCTSSSCGSEPAERVTHCW